MPELLKLIGQLPLTDILKLGLPGLIFLLCFLAFGTLWLEQRKKKRKPNKAVLFSASLFLVIGLVGGIVAALIGPSSVVGAVAGQTPPKAVRVTGSVTSAEGRNFVGILSSNQYKPALDDGSFCVDVPAGEDPYIAIAINETDKGVKIWRQNVEVKDGKGSFNWPFTGGPQ